MESEDVKFIMVMTTRNPNLTWLKEALNSARGLFDYIMIIDDASTVPVDMFLQRFNKQGLKGDYFQHLKQEGVWGGRNTGCNAIMDVFPHFNGWVITLDDDDQFINANVKKLKEIALKTDADILHFPVELFGEQKGQWGNYADMSKILDGNQIPSGSWYRFHVWKTLRGFQEPTAEDWDFWARATKHRFKFEYFDQPIYRHRMRAGSVSGSWTGDKFINIRNSIRKNYEKERI